MTTVIMVKEKSVAVALLLSFFFGPLGMFYATTPGALIMLLVDLVVVIFTMGFALIITIPIGMIWAAVSVKGYNKNLRLAQAQKN